MLPIRGRPIVLYLYLLGVFLLTGAVAAGAWWWWGHQDGEAITESHPLEWSQAGLLAAAAFIHFLRSGHATTVAWRFAWLGAALFCVSLMLREIDIDAITPHAGWSVLEWIIRVLAGLVWIALTWRLAVHWHRVRPQMRPIVGSAMVLLTGVGCLFYALSWPFDKFEFDVGPFEARFLEETAQLIATLLLLTAAGAPSASCPTRSPAEQRSVDGEAGR